MGAGLTHARAGAARRAMPMLAFFCGLALIMHGVGAWRIHGLFMQPSIHYGMALLLVGGVFLALGWHMPEKGAARRAMPMLAFSGGLALLMHGFAA